jgi:hypothetical protein
MFLQSSKYWLNRWLRCIKKEVRNGGFWHKRLFPSVTTIVGFWVGSGQEPHRS